MRDRESSSTEVKRHTVTDGGGQRLDKFLAEQYGLSVRRAKTIIEAGSVLVNGAKKLSGHTLSQGDEIILTGEISESHADGKLFTAEALQVLFEDKNILAVVKPREMHSVRLRAENSSTVADFIAGYLPGAVEASPDPREAGLVQRLDYFTCGILLAAKNRKSWQELRSLMDLDQIEKEYLALVEGAVSAQRIERPLVQVKGGTKMATSDEGLPASTVVSPIVTGKQFSIVKCVARSARRHQIRVHLASIGHPLVGDELYGSERGLEEILNGRKGFLLHASRIKFSWHGRKVELTIVSNELEMVSKRLSVELSSAFNPEKQ